MPMMVQRSVDDEATENDAEDVAADIRECVMYYFTTIGISAIMCVRSYIINQVHVPY